jgi:hypothetical protein
LADRTSTAVGRWRPHLLSMAAPLPRWRTAPPQGYREAVSRRAYPANHQGQPGLFRKMPPYRMRIPAFPRIPSADDGRVDWIQSRKEFEASRRSFHIVLLHSPKRIEVTPSATCNKNKKSPYSVLF